MPLMWRHPRRNLLHLVVVALAEGNRKNGPRPSLVKNRVKMAVSVRQVNAPLASVVVGLIAHGGQPAWLPDQHQGDCEFEAIGFRETRKCANHLK